MAEETIILDIELNADAALTRLTSFSNKMKELRDEKKKLDEVVKDGKATEAQVARLKEVEAQININKKEMKSLTAQLDLTRKGYTEYGDSLDDMRRKLSDMQKVYDGLSKAERENADVGGKLQTAIKEQHDAVLELEGATGRMQRNVGNYQQAFENAIPGMSKFSGTLNTMGVSMEDLAGKGTKAFSGLGKSVQAFGKMFLTPPIIVITAIVGAIVLVFEKLKEAFKKSDDAGTALEAGLSALKPIGTAIGKVFDALANIIGKMVEGFGELVSSVAKAGAALGLWSDEAGNAAENAMKLTYAEDNLEETERQYTENSAKRNKEIAELRDKAMKAGDPEERKKLLKKALDLEQKNMEDEKAIAAERVRILEAKAKQENDTSDDTKNKISQARAAMYEAEERYYTGTRRLQKEYLKAADEIDKEEQAKVEEKKRRYEEYLAKRKEQAQKEEEIAKQLEDALLAAIEDEDARAMAQAQVQGDREIAALKKRLKEEKDLTKKAKEDIALLIEEKQRQLDETLERMAEEAAKKRQDEYNAKALAAVDAENERHRALLEARLANNEEDIELQKEMLQLQFDAYLEQMQEQLELELENKALSEEQRQTIEDEYKAIRLEKEIEFTNRLSQIDQEYADRQQEELEAAKERLKDNMKDLAKNTSNTFGAISDLLAQYGEDNEKAAAASKAFAIAQIVTDQALSIASTAKSFALAVEGATTAAAATGPAAPFTLAAYITEMVALVAAATVGLISSFTQAKSVLSEANTGSYATGGIIGGSSYTGDRLTANVNSGEMILNRDQQTRLFDIANGQGGNIFDYSIMTEAMVAAVAAQPAPVMAYEEFKSFQSRTATYDEFARI